MDIRTYIQPDKIRTEKRRNEADFFSHSKKRENVKRSSVQKRTTQIKFRENDYEKIVLPTFNNLAIGSTVNRTRFKNEGFVYSAPRYTSINPYANSAVKVKPDFTYTSTAKKAIEIGKYFNKAAYCICFAAAILMPILLLSVYIPLLKLDLGTSKIRPIIFSSDQAAESAMRAYLFPAPEISMTDKLPSVSDTGNIPIPIVEYKNYTVNKGDTISGIAAKFGLRNISSVLSVNNISNAKKIMPGDRIKIPSIDGIIYKAGNNDSLSSIAAAYNIPLTYILDANDLSSQDLRIGQNIFIPGASLSAFDLRKAIGELFIYPIQGRLTSPFGYRRDPFTGRRSFHSGIDLAAPIGTPIKVTLDGKIAEVGFNRIFGNYIIVTHSGGYQSLYGHMSKTFIKRGQYVSQSTPIGAVGSTGMSTGPHLHLSIYKNGKMIDPLKVLEK